MAGNVEFWKSAENLNRLMKQKVCLAEGSATPCEGRIISAHTVARSQLEKIAVKGHVKASDASAAQLEKSGGNISVRDVGIGEFSTLNCFCAKHDANIFSDVESVPLTFSARQLSILHYRATASELYRKTQGHQGTLKSIELFERKTGQEARDKVSFLKAMSAGEELGIRDMTTALSNALSILADEQYDTLNALVVRFKRPPSIMTVGAFFPEVDFEGKKLSQLGDHERVYELVSFHVLAGDDGNAAVALVWNKTDPIGLAFAKSYLSQKSELYATLAIQFAFECFENMCMGPTWWDGLKKVEQDVLVRRLSSVGKSGNNYLEFAGIVHDDWSFSSSGFIGLSDASPAD